LDDDNPGQFGFGLGKPAGLQGNCPSTQQFELNVEPIAKRWLFSDFTIPSPDTAPATTRKFHNFGKYVLSLGKALAQ
jgi:hypothetical protein